VSGDKLVLCSV